VDLGGTKTYGSYGSRSGCVSGTLVHLHHSSKIRSHKEVTKQKKSRFFLLFFLDDPAINSAKCSSIVGTGIVMIGLKGALQTGTRRGSHTTGWTNYQKVDKISCKGRYETC
jgi:hypothetical protein